jgi:alkylation response protein AidB-like acyl-CoA dehydrogenase
MDFAIPATTRALLGEVAAFVRDELFPREGDVLGQPWALAAPVLDGLRGRVKERGWWAPQAPRELGGMGLALVEHGLVSEALGQSPLGHYVFGCQAPDAGNLEILHLHATEDQKRRYLEPLARGDVRSCFAMTEPDVAGSNPTLLRCRATRDGGDYVIDGRKWFASAAEGAAFAIVMAVTDEAAPPHRRATMILVPTDTPGYRLVRNVPVMGHTGDGYFSHAELAFEACRVPQANRLGPEGGGFAVAQERLGPGRIHHCMRWLGICERAFSLLCRRAATRQISATRVLGEESLVQSWIAECRAGIEAARLMVLRAAWTIDHQGFEAAAEQVSLIKFFVAGVLDEVLDRAIQVHGALGISGDTPLWSFYAYERGARIYDGPDEVHKVAAARRILKRYAP